jgi:hypothetical protein
MKVSDLEKEDWQELVEKINDESCILLLGPNLYKNKGGEVLQDVLYNKLRTKFEADLFDFFPEDGFFVPADYSIINDMRRIVKNFYKEDYPDDYLKKIIQIPFHCIISLTPDLLLKRAFEKYNLVMQFERFSMTQPVNESLEEATKKTPILYNIFGSIEEDETIILTHNDFFSYLKNIMGDDRLPDQIKRAINKATDLIFLGFTFEKWWIQLLMRLLGLHAFPGRNRWAVEVCEDTSFSKITKKQFRIKFIEDESDKFIDILYKHARNKSNFLNHLNLISKEAELTELEISNKRVSEIKEQMVKVMDLVTKYEKKKLLSDDPKEIERCNDELDKLNNEIKEKSAELQSLKS